MKRQRFTHRHTPDFTAFHTERHRGRTWDWVIEALRYCHQPRYEKEFTAFPQGKVLNVPTGIVIA